jgi:hypothetical protein
MNSESVPWFGALRQVNANRVSQTGALEFDSDYLNAHDVVL